MERNSLAAFLFLALLATAQVIEEVTMLCFDFTNGDGEKRILNPSGIALLPLSALDISERSHNPFGIRAALCPSHSIWLDVWFKERHSETVY